MHTRDKLNARPRRSSNTSTRRLDRSRWSYNRSRSVTCPDRANAAGFCTRHSSLRTEEMGQKQIFSKDRTLLINHFQLEKWDICPKKQSNSRQPAERSPSPVFTPRIALHYPLILHFAFKAHPHTRPHTPTRFRRPYAPRFTGFHTFSRLLITESGAPQNSTFSILNSTFIAVNDA